MTRPTADEIIGVLGPAADYLPCRYLDEPPQRIASVLWRMAQRRRNPAIRMALKAAAIRLAGLAKGGSR